MKLRTFACVFVGALALSLRASPAPLTISFSLWALYDMDRGGVWEDCDARMRELKERGFNCVRIDDCAGLWCAPDGTPRGKVKVHPAFGKFSADVRQVGMVSSERTFDPRERLVRFFRAADRHGMKVILSCWYYIHINWMTDETINRQLYEGLSTDGKMAYFTDELNRALGALREHRLDHCVAFAELFNEFDGLCFTARYGRIDDEAEAERIRDLHEKAIARLKAANPGVKFAYDTFTANMQANLIPRNADVLNFHDYYFWPIYDTFTHGAEKATVTETPIPAETRAYLKEPPVTIAEIVATRRGNLRVSNDWNPRVRLYASLDDAKIPALERKFEERFAAEHDGYLQKFAKNVAVVVRVRDEVLPGKPIVFGEGVSYCASNRFLFEEHSDRYWDMLCAQAKILREAGVWGAVPRTLSGPEDPSWTLRAKDLRRVNGVFADVKPELPFGDAGHAASVTWRLGTPVEKDGDFFNLLDFFKRHRLTGKLSFFIATSHTPARLELIRQQTDPVARRLRQLREAGYPAGVNPLCTLGHVDEGLDMCVDIPDAMRFTNVHGQSAKGNFCPSDQVWREKYVKPFYEIVARMKPDFIYTDDDIRLLWHAVPGKGCFCDRCMERIRRRLGYEGDRAGLEAWLADPVSGESRKRRLLQYNRELLADLYEYIAGVIHAVDPKIPVGAMDCNISYHGSPFEEIYRQLSRYGNEVYWRPGGGFYNDNMPDQSIGKANSLAGECAYLPPGVAKVEAEVENFNYQRLNKSIHMTSQEALLYIAAGCRGVAWNVFPSTDFDSWSTSDRLADALEALRPKMDAAVLACGTARPQGVWNGLGRDAYMAHNRGRANWLDGDAGGSSDLAFLGSKLQKIGIPAAYREEDCVVWAPSVESVWSLETNAIARLLSGGAYLSAEAAAALVERGFAADIGFVPDGEEPGFTNERLLEHPLTTGIVGLMRDGRKSFWGGTVTRLKPLAGAKAMSETVGDRNVLVSPCVSGTFENARGGRVFVTGYYPWSRLFYQHTADSMKRVFRWLSRDRLSLVGSFHRAVLWQRGERALALYNASLDRAEGLDLLLPKRLAARLKVVGTDQVVEGSDEGAYRRYRVPAVDAWSVAFYEIVK